MAAVAEPDRAGARCGCAYSCGCGAAEGGRRGGEWRVAGGWRRGASSARAPHTPQQQGRPTPTHNTQHSTQHASIPAEQVAGWRVDYDGLSFVTVRNAGHMVPYVQPERAYYMAAEFLREAAAAAGPPSAAAAAAA